MLGKVNCSQAFLKSTRADVLSTYIHIFPQISDKCTLLHEQWLMHYIKFNKDDDPKEFHPHMGLNLTEESWI